MKISCLTDAFAIHEEEAAAIVLTKACILYKHKNDIKNHNAKMLSSHPQFIESEYDSYRFVDAYACGKNGEVHIIFDVPNQCNLDACCELYGKLFETKDVDAISDEEYESTKAKAAPELCFKYLLNNEVRKLHAQIQ